VLPIASLTKLMTGLVISEAKLPMDEQHHHQRGRRRHRKAQQLAPEGRHHAEPRRADAPGADVQREPRRHALGRTYPGGMNAFVEA
jgi:D-alanyl-D-alanine endopeptidase (penicillin-binding protein 7)